MTMEQLLQAVAKKVEKAHDLRSKVLFVLDGDKYIHVDASQRPATISTEQKPADCTIRTSLQTFTEILLGKTSATMAYMFGKIKIEGNMGVAMAISRIL
ncbi:MAG: SCP2 sterol-binding domain-containing protein [Bacteroidia bacterium]|nr:SCP2 sterol-binding domain-containing protein [Bacteroidia bacterium]MDW8236258.1 SCP2 sterol-binding domain-containing protein [Bacteroidia bacterium]